MIRAIYTAAASMLARMNQLEVVGNNLANANTVGYKQDRLHFRALLDGQAMANSEGALAGAEVVSTRFGQGSVVETASDFDLALEGNGFFVVRAGDREYYTRNGHFTLNGKGEVVTSHGYNVVGENGPIVADHGDFHVTATGEIVVGNTVINKLRIVDFPDPAQLAKHGENLFSAPATAAVPSACAVRQGYVEESNVNVLQQMIELIDIQHAFESSEKAIQAEDETLRRAVNDLGKVS